MADSDLPGTEAPDALANRACAPDMERENTPSQDPEDIMNDKTPAERPARRDIGDDLALPFTVDTLDVRGRLVRMGRSVNEAIRQHAYPEPVSRLLGEIMALSVLLGTSLKFDGKLIVQTRTDGPVNMLVADFTTPGYVRGLARFDEDAVNALSAEEARDPARLMGTGHLVFTIDQGPNTERYQGVVALSGSLAEAAENYFAQSEQIPTRVRLAAGEVSDATGSGWRAGAAMIQHLPPAAGSRPQEEEEAAADNWPRAVALFDTIEDHEMLDPDLSPERLLYRLFHEDGVRVFDPVPVEWRCNCSREQLLETIRRFSKEERAAMVENSRITATCQFCSATYEFTPEEAGLTGDATDAQGGDSC